MFLNYKEQIQHWNNETDMYKKSTCENCFRENKTVKNLNDAYMCYQCFMQLKVFRKDQ